MANQRHERRQTVRMRTNDQMPDVLGESETLQCSAFNPATTKVQRPKEVCEERTAKATVFLKAGNDWPMLGRQHPYDTRRLRPYRESGED
jgi:hypothetical protein